MQTPFRGFMQFIERSASPTGKRTLKWGALALTRITYSLAMARSRGAVRPKRRSSEAAAVLSGHRAYEHIGAEWLRGLRILLQNFI